MVDCLFDGPPGVWTVQFQLHVYFSPFRLDPKDGSISGVRSSGRDGQAGPDVLVIFE